MSFNKTKCDPVLGLAVQQYLTKVGVQTPTIPSAFTDKQKIDVIESKMYDVLQALGLDLEDDSLAETPNRVAKMFVNELYWGLDYEKFPKCTTVSNKMKYDEMVIEKNVKIMSDCEHHLRTIYGTATIAYIPKNKVLGLSKLNRVADYFARRPQIQERLTEQIFHALCFILETNDVAVVIDAKHMCVSQRGIEDVGSHTVTSKLGGSFKTKPDTRSEFLMHVAK